MSLAPLMALMSAQWFQRHAYARSSPYVVMRRSLAEAEAQVHQRLHRRKGTTMLLPTRSLHQESAGGLASVHPWAQDICHRTGRNVKDAAVSSIQLDRL